MSSPSLARRLALRQDAYYVPTDDGVHIRTHRGEVTLSGRATYQWIDKLAPFLDGGHTVAELTASLSTQRRQFVESLLESLLDSGALREADEAPAQGGAAGYVGYFRTGGAAAHAAYAEGTVALLAPEYLRPALATACAATGLHRFSAALPGDEQPGEDLPGAAYAVHVTDLAGLGTLAEVQRACARHGATLVQALLVGGDVWVRPAIRPGEAGLAAAWERLCARSGVPHGDTVLAEPARTVLANHLAHELLRGGTGIRDAKPGNRLLRFEPAELRSTEHRFVPPRSARAPESAAEFGARLDALRAAGELSEDEFSRRMAALSDPWLGVFGELTERNFAQLPVCVATTTVAGGAEVIGLGATFAEARYRAAREALRTYCTAQAQQHSTMDGTWYRDLADDTVHALTAAPRAHEVATGYGWDAAVTAGLVAHAGRLTVAELDTAGTPFPEITEVTDDVAAYCLRMLAAAGRAVRVYDVTGPLRVRAVACALDGVVRAYGFGTDAAAALRDGLRTLAAAYQSAANDEPEYAPAAVPDLPAHLRGAEKPLRSGTVSAAELVTALRGRGLRAAVAPLDHDQEVHQAMPYVVHVVVTGDDA